jgi:cytosine/adenosine deaminase-related metal-dependent hydrolase
MTKPAGMAESGAIAGLCPITEANLGDGNRLGFQRADRFAG